MARTHSILRAEASRSDSPGEILARANALLEPEMPARMFVTCLFAILDPSTGRIVLANAGHNLPYIRTDDGVIELRATGMPLGLMPGITYEETEGVIAPGSNVLLYSDGLVEAHDPDRQMYGFPRLREEMAIDDAGSELLDRLLDTLHRFTGPDWEQEDDITLVTLRRASGVARRTPATAMPRPHSSRRSRSRAKRATSAWPWTGSRPPSPTSDSRRRGSSGSRRPSARPTMNAIEYGSQGRADVPVDIVVETTAESIVVRITDRALSGAVPDDAEAPDIERKLAGDQKPRGWGLFLIKNMVDSMDVTSDGTDPDGDPDDGARGARAMDDRRFGAVITEVPEEVRVRLSGDLNARADETLADTYAQVAALGPQRVSLDFGRVGYINSTGIALVVRLLADARRDGRTVRAIGLTEHYQEIFRITRLSDFMEIVEGDAA